jgi:hypothetical protein
VTPLSKTGGVIPLQELRYLTPGLNANYGHTGQPHNTTEVGEQNDQWPQEQGAENAST